MKSVVAKQQPNEEEFHYLRAYKCRADERFRNIFEFHNWEAGQPMASAWLLRHLLFSVAASLKIDIILFKGM